MRLSNKSAFTLAEVLITLGIIGVVAAMTMPTLMNSTQGAQYKAAYKKALSALSQAVTLNVALDDYNFSTASGSTTENGSVYAIFKNRMNVVKTIEGTTGYLIDLGDKDKAGFKSGKINEGSNYTLFFNDGIVFSFPTTAANCTNDETINNVTICKGFIDVNGEKNPNRVVKCDKGNATDDSCVVTNPTDVYPVIFYDQTVLPGTAAARNVLYGDGKSK